MSQFGSMDMLKSQLLTMTMLDKNNGNNSDNTGGINGGMNVGNGGGNNHITTAIYGIIMMTLIDTIIKALPVIFAKIESLIKEYVQKNTANSYDKLLLNLKDNSKTIKSRITFERSFVGDNPLSDISDAILDIACKKDSALELKFRNNFFISNVEEFHITNEIIFKLQNIERNKDGGITLISFHVFSYSLGLLELRSWVNNVTDKFKEDKRNELGTSRFFFDEIAIDIPKNIDGSYRFELAPKNLNFTLSKFETTKSLSNLFGSHIDIIKKRVDHFSNNPEWFKKNGVPYTLGLLLYGKPGCGKTSLIKAIAKDTKRHIVNLQLKPTTTKSQLKQLFYSNLIHIVENGVSKNYYIPTDERIYVLEDIDCLCDVVLERKKDTDTTTTDSTALTDLIPQSNSRPSSLHNSQSNSETTSQNEHESEINPLDSYFNNDLTGNSGDVDIDQFSSLVHTTKVPMIVHRQPPKFGRNANMTNNFSIGNGMMNEMGNGMMNEMMNGMGNGMMNGMGGGGNGKGKVTQDISGEIINLSFLLNIMDGVLETPGRILIMTSNYPEKLDGALTRPGRIDLKIEFTPCDKKMIHDMFSSFYSVDDKEKYSFDFVNNSDDNKSKIKPCELQEILNNHYDN